MLDEYYVDDCPGSDIRLYKVKHVSFCISYLLLYNTFFQNSEALLGDSGSKSLIGCSQGAM